MPSEQRVRLLAVAGDGRNFAVCGDQIHQVVRYAVTDSSIETTRAVGAFQNVPDRNAVIDQERALGFIILKFWRPIDRFQHPPELVSRMRIVLLKSDRLVTRQ